MSIFTHIEFDQHEQVVFCHDAKSGLRAIIAVHNTSRGPALGGCRMWPYASDQEALNDVLRLSRGMTYKSALANLPLGGGKAVIIGDPRKDKSPELLRALGTFIERLDGRYITAEDSGTSVADMAIIGEATQYVSGVVHGSAHGGDPSPSTAYGTYVGLKQAVKHRLGTDSVSGLKIAIQGVGNVGHHLANYLKRDGAELIITDIFRDNIDRTVATTSARVVEPDQIFDVDADVFAPCAMGGILNDLTIPRLKAQVIAGAANNQLGKAAHGAQLAAADVLYAPDYVLNAGGIIDIAYQRSGEGEAALKAHIEGIGDTLAEIFYRASEMKKPTDLVANQLAEERFQRC